MRLTSQVSPTLAALVLIAQASLSACSAMTFDPVKCDTAQECRDAFGVDQGWNTEGFCEAVQLPDRCSGMVPGTGVYPDDLFTNPDFTNAILFGSEMDFSQLDQRGRANAIKLAAFEANQEPEGL